MLTGDRAGPRALLDGFFRTRRAEHPEDFAIATALAAQLGSIGASTERLRCAVLIPVAAGQEVRHIHRTLCELADQSLDHSQYEVYLGVNAPRRRDDPDGPNGSDQFSSTLAEIDRFRAACPQLTVRAYTQLYERQHVPIGRVRADLFAATGLHLWRRGLVKDLLMVSGDADVVSLNRDYLMNMVDVFEQTGAAFVTASIRNALVRSLPLSAPLNRLLLWQGFLDLVRDRHRAVLHTSDANTAVSLTEYVRVGGHDPRLEMAEMQDLARRIRQSRGRVDGGGPERKAHRVEVKARSARLQTHPRRQVWTMAMGHHPMRAWARDVLAFEESDEVRLAPMNIAQAAASAAEHEREWTLEMTTIMTERLPDPVRRTVGALAERHLAGGSALPGGAARERASDPCWW